MSARASGALSVEGVSVDLAGHRIIEEVALSAHGNVVGLVGPNGSGKSTLLRTIYRMLRPAEGTVLADDRDVWSMSAKEAARFIAAVVQDNPVDLELTVLDCVTTGRLPHGSLLGSGRAEDGRVVELAMRRAGVEDFADRDMSTLSGGERQRVQLARALAQEPRLLVLDEPTNHLDCRSGSSVTSVSYLDGGGRTSGIGWGYTGKTTAKGVVRNVGYVYGQYNFKLNIAGVDVQKPSYCARAIFTTAVSRGDLACGLG